MGLLSSSRPVFSSSEGLAELRRLRGHKTRQRTRAIIPTPPRTPPTIAPIVADFPGGKKVELLGEVSTLPVLGASKEIVVVPALDVLDEGVVVVGFEVAETRLEEKAGSR